jgi:hypothetical protein
MTGIDMSSHRNVARDHLTVTIPVDLDDLLTVVLVLIAEWLQRRATGPNEYLDLTFAGLPFSCLFYVVYDNLSRLRINLNKNVLISATLALTNLNVSYCPLTFSFPSST